MAGNPKQPQVGDLAIDASACASYAVVLDRTDHLRSEKVGVDEVVAEIEGNQASLGVKSAIPQADVDALDETNKRLADIDLLLPAARRLVLILEHTRIQLVDDRERVIGSIAEIVTVRSKRSGNEGLLAAYSKTRAYRSATALKGLRTRRRNVKAAQSEAPPADEHAAPTTTATTPAAPAATGTNGASH